MDEEAQYTALDNQLEYKSGFAGGENTLTVGADLSRQRKDGVMGWDNSYNIPLTDPGYDFPVSQPGPYVDSRTTVIEKGLYLQDHLTFENGATLTAGLRRSWIENETVDRLAGSRSLQKDNVTTGMVGAPGIWAMASCPMPAMPKALR